MSTSHPVPVTIYRRKPTARESWTWIVRYLVDLALTAWILMLALGMLTPWPLGYWPTLFALVVLRSIRGGSVSAHELWTREEGRP